MGKVCREEEDFAGIIFLIPGGRRQTAERMGMEQPGNQAGKL
jgi:hypothetical protein